MPTRISDWSVTIVTFLITFLATNSVCKGTKATRIIVWLDICVSGLSGVYHSTVNVLPRISDRKASIKGLARFYVFDFTEEGKEKAKKNHKL